MKKKSILYNLKVLYVEDEEMIREELASFIKRRVGKLYIAVDGEDGLMKFNEYEPDLIITDLKMPKMNGLEMAKKIRNIDQTCPIIVITAISDVDSIINTIDVGIDKYIIKPIDTRELVATMERAALKLYKIKSKDTIINSIILEKDVKKDFENKIQKEIARFIKHYTGKGPKNVQAFIQGDLLTIQCFETRTIYEKALLDNLENIRLVNYSRELFFKDKRKEIESNIKEILKASIQMDEIITDSRLDIDQIKFKIL
ncbi:Na-translocating system protein MpsC family protein [Crassaminicella profunda]|uniref:Na-translocating system protein MpsC family protein n=1 Tax=Crassaminicella profunda TaxID=1286698 RepID=UPI001CA6E0D0|nr:Na-translocating system protein MpsC family protein [Crassaminicella profunda]QZY53612.1 Na-translocating system protein MpsC family protein [Crassaminicella profunda]